MSLNNAITMKLNERKKIIARFRWLYHELDEVIDAIYHPGLYTVSEYDALASRYRSLQIEADKLENCMRRNFLHTDLDEKIKWFKSHPRDDNVAASFEDNPNGR